MKQIEQIENFFNTSASAKIRAVLEQTSTGEGVTFWQIKQNANELEFEISHLFNNGIVIDMVITNQKTEKIVARVNESINLRQTEDDDTLEFRIEYAEFRGLVYKVNKTNKEKLDELVAFSKAIENVFSAEHQ